MRTLKERITDLESQIALIDSQIANQGPDYAKLQVAILDGKIASMKQRLQMMEAQRSMLVSTNSNSKNDARVIKRERLVSKLKTLNSSYLNYMESIGKEPGTEGKDAFDTLLDKKK